jgi:hypothetical protein
MDAAATHRARIDIPWQQCHGPLSCDLCSPADEPDAVPAITVRPSAERPATVTPARLGSVPGDALARQDAVFADALPDY